MNEEDGKHYHLTLKFPLNDAKGNPYAICTVASDITEFKEKEQELEIAKEKAEKNEMLTRGFLHNISHEIRTPLNSIMGFAYMLNDNSITAEEKEKLYRYNNLQRK